MSLRVVPPAEQRVPQAAALEREEPAPAQPALRELEPQALEPQALREPEPTPAQRPTRVRQMRQATQPHPEPAVISNQWLLKNRL
jgi:hypothetical protein